MIYLIHSRNDISFANMHNCIKIYLFPLRKLKIKPRAEVRLISTVELYLSLLENSEQKIIIPCWKLVWCIYE
jgi:hypothetical protein